MIFSNILLLALIGCASSQSVLSKRGGSKELIGFVMSRDDNLPFLDDIKDAQLGKGLYLVHERELLSKIPNNVGDRPPKYCAVYADVPGMTRVSKMWVPLCDGATQVWGNEDAINRRILGLPWKWKPEKTLRLAQIDPKNPHELRLAIPETLRNEKGGALGLEMRCEDKLDNLPPKGVDFERGFFRKNQNEDNLIVYHQPYHKKTNDVCEGP